MANDNKHDQVASVEQRLKSLYELQTILSEIDRIKQIRGELPLEVKDLEDEIAGLNTRIENYSREIEEMQQNLASEREKIKSAEDLISRYKEQLDNVRNNREFDLLTKEVEFQNLEIELCEKHINDFSRAIKNKQRDIKSTEDVLEDRNHTLSEKREELNEIVSETREQEDTLRNNAKALEPKIDERTLLAFKRIRKNARNGLGIVYVERNACGGCFNRIPPQKQAEIKMHKKVIVCEYCGRIMIDPDLAGVVLPADPRK
jgi:predicted  nucleic acid-binding Zn-ribbon protein